MMQRQAEAEAEVRLLYFFFQPDFSLVFWVTSDLSQIYQRFLVLLGTWPESRVGHNDWSKHYQGQNEWRLPMTFIAIPGILDSVLIALSINSCCFFLHYRFLSVFCFGVFVRIVTSGVTMMTSVSECLCPFSLSLSLMNMHCLPFQFLYFCDEHFCFVSVVISSGDPSVNLSWDYSWIWEEVQVLWNNTRRWWYLERKRERHRKTHFQNECLCVWLWVHLKQTDTLDGLLTFKRQRQNRRWTNVTLRKKNECGKGKQWLPYQVVVDKNNKQLIHSFQSKLLMHFPFWCFFVSFKNHLSFKVL
jgi:hypothetical protein